MWNFRAFSFLFGALWLGAPGDGKPARVPAGLWGGQGIGLEVSAGGGTLGYDCARGTIDEPMVVDSEGRFDVKGTHHRERPGPAREGESKGRPVRYTGTVDGETMKLTVTLAGSDERIGTFTLVRGKQPRIRKCM